MTHEATHEALIGESDTATRRLADAILFVCGVAVGVLAILCLLATL